MSRMSCRPVVAKCTYLLPQVRAVQKTVEELQRLRGTHNSSSATSNPTEVRKYRQRRTTSHSRYRHSRRPNAKLLAAAEAAAAKSTAEPPRHACVSCTGVLDVAHKLSHSEAYQPPSNVEANAQAPSRQVFVRPTSRAMRRRCSRLQEEVQNSCSSPFDACDGGRRKLETHRWHVKRMSMVLRCHLCRYV